MLSSTTRWLSRRPQTNCSQRICVAANLHSSRSCSEDKPKDGLSRGAYHEVQNDSQCASPDADPKAKLQQLQRKIRDNQNMPQFGSMYNRQSGRGPNPNARQPSRTEPPKPSTIPLDSLITSTPLASLSRADCNKYADVSGAKFKWPAGLQEQFALFKEEAIMVREPAIIIMEGLTQFKERGGSEAMPTIVVHGDRGTGKSTTLAHVANACAQSGWLVLHNPSSLQHTTMSQRVERSVWKDGRIDQAFDAADLLLAFKQGNQKLLSEIKLSGSYNIEGAKFDSKKSLLDLVSHGAGPYDLQSLAKPPTSCDVLGAVCKELRLVTSVPVLIAVDNFNAYFNSTSLYGFDSARLHALQLSIARFFTKFTHPDHNLKNGVLIIGATETGVQTTQKLGPEIRDMLHKSTRIVPSNELPAGGLKGTVRVRTPQFSTVELHHFLSYYRQKGLFSHDVDMSVVAEVAGLSGCVPAEVTRVCAVA